MYYFIVNYTGGSGKAKKTWDTVHYLLKKKDVDYKAYVTKRQGHARELAKRISEFEEDDIRIVVVGGDGTINEVLNGITDYSRVRFGVIPTGSGNDFSRGMGIPKDTATAVDTLLNSVRGKEIDLGEVITDDGVSHTFAISSGIGLDAIVCKKMITSKVKRFMNRIRLGSLSYLIVTVTTLFSMKTYKVKVQMTEKDGKDVSELAFKDLIFMAAMNFPAEGGGVPMNPNAVADDGLLSICAVSGIPKWRTFFLLPKLKKGKHEGKKGFMLKDVKSLVFDAEEPMVLHTDGEYIGDVTHIEMNIKKNVLNVMV